MLRTAIMTGLLAVMIASCIREPQPLLSDTPAGYGSERQAEAVTETPG